MSTGLIRAFGAFRFHQDRRKRLADFVVKLARQGAALVFLRAQEQRG
jgi:hypothetical protein